MPLQVQQVFLVQDLYLLLPYLLVSFFSNLPLTLKPSPLDLANFPLAFKSNSFEYVASNFFQSQGILTIFQGVP